MGYQVEMLTTTSDPKKFGSEQWAVEVHDGIRVHYLYLPYESKLSYYRRILVFLSFMRAASRRLLGLQVDLVLASSTPLTIGIPAMVKKFFHRTPYIFEVRDVWPEAVFVIGAISNPLLRWLLLHLERSIYRYSFAIVPLSSDMRRSIITRYPFLENHTIEVIENISEVQRFQAESAEGENLIENLVGSRPRYTVLYAGSFGKVNGIGYAIHLAELLLPIDPSVVLLLVGDGAELENCRNEAEQKGVLGKNIFIAEPVSKDRLPSLYREADIGSSFVIPVKELWYNSANKFFDTLAAGKPILINYGGWQNEVIQLKNIGFVLPPVLSEEAVRKFAEYTCKEQLQKEQQRNALAMASEDYSLESALSRYRKLFGRLVDV
ncbi:MAG: glycosyltransferase family 4 protein [Flavobacteriales bacterium]|nr:glycosyltransferase family 4 protein [Flavobacteriales bacterium]